jgi:hypothetical protein
MRERAGASARPNFVVILSRASTNTSTAISSFARAKFNAVRTVGIQPAAKREQLGTNRFRLSGSLKTRRMSSGF